MKSDWSLLYVRNKNRMLLDKHLSPCGCFLSPSGCLYVPHNMYLSSIFFVLSIRNFFFPPSEVSISCHGIFSQQTPQVCGQLSWTSTYLQSLFLRFSLN